MAYNNKCLPLNNIRGYNGDGKNKISGSLLTIDNIIVREYLK